MSANSRSLKLWHVAAFMLAASIGTFRCGPVDLFPSGSAGDAAVPGIEQPEVVAEIEPNDDFDSAMAVNLSGPVELRGSIDRTGDRDVYALGPVNAGDYVSGTSSSENGSNVIFCLLDARERLLARCTAGGSCSLLMPESTDVLYLLAFMLPESSGQSYSATMGLRPNAGRWQSRPQVVVLDFRGAATLSVGGYTYQNVPPFDAADIDATLAGQTTTVINRVLELVRQDYAGLNVQLYLSTDPQVPSGGSVVYFGASNPELLGISQGVDPYNASPADQAIVYTGTFRLFMSLDPDTETIAQSLANVTSHEIGHLLGLRHTSDCDDLMDITASAQRLLEDQWFKLARLHASVCPLGYQDAPTMLSWSVGGQLAAPVPNLAKSIKPTGGVDFQIPRELLCSGCLEAKRESTLRAIPPK